MSKWRIWEDSYRGDQWNDRTEISRPEFEGEEIPDDEVEERLLGLLNSESEEYVTIEDDEDRVWVGMDFCLNCMQPVFLCKCGQADTVGVMPVSFHAERVE